MKIRPFFLACLSYVTTMLSAQTYEPHYRLINDADYPTGDLAVASYNIMDYEGADNTGQRDQTQLIQALLCRAGGLSINMVSSNVRDNYDKMSGGIVYLPAGKYLCTGTLVVPRGVTLRGDWQRPSDDGCAASGTILMVRTLGARGSVEENRAFITMQPATEVSHLTFWYPQQTADDVRPYPATILFGHRGYWGNGYCNVRHCTFLNSYTAIQMSETSSAGCPNIFDVCGSPLSQGIVMDCIADVGRFDGIRFSPAFWAQSGSDNAPSEAALRSYLKQNATGFVMRRNDWSYTCNYTCDGYKTGFSAEPSPETANTKGTPNGHNYGFKLKDCVTGMHFKGASGAGIMCTRITTDGCQTAIRLEAGLGGPVQLYSCQLGATSTAIEIADHASSVMMMQDCDVLAPMMARGGDVVACGNRFSRDAVIFPNARINAMGNTFSSGAALKNSSIFDCSVSETPLTLRPLPEYKAEWMVAPTTRPARAALYVVTDAEFGAKPVDIHQDQTQAQDNTEAIRKALDKARQEGGGIVYLPSGHYRMNGSIVIPAGVELKGSGDLAATPHGHGAVLEVFADEGNENGTPFITMEPGSGLRGVSVNYPRQNDPFNVKKYPYTVRGNANTYIVNLALRTAYRGIDLFTNKCDNHYVDYLAGHCFMNVVRVGGGSTQGIISNIQCNTIAYACGDETKFGQWPNSMNMAADQGNLQDKGYGQNKEDLDFMIIGHTTDQVLYNNFLFGCNKGMHFVSDNGQGATRVHALGNAVDGAVNTFVFDALGDDLDLINSQVVALNHNGDATKVHQSYLPATFVTMSAQCTGKTVTMFNSDHWGSGEYFTNIQAGTMNFYLPNLHASGKEWTFDASAQGRINFEGGYVTNLKKLARNQGSTEQQVSVIASLCDLTGANQSTFAQWTSVLPLAWGLSNDVTMSHYRWSTKAFNDANGNGGSASAKDGNLSSYWSTNTAQVPGQWWRVNFASAKTFNTIILRSHGNDSPAAYKIETSDDDNNWTEIAAGENAGVMLVVNIPAVTAKYVRVTQTGSKSNYWAINEFDIAQLDESIISGVETLHGDNAQSVSYSDGALMLDGYANGARIEVYTLKGHCVLADSTRDTSYDLSTLARGLYIVVVTGADGQHETLKLTIR